MRHADCITSFAPPSINHEPIALDEMETRFFERCRRNTTNVTYPHHIPVPRPVTNFQRRGLRYQSACGNQLGAPLPILGSTISLPTTTCPVLQPVSQQLSLQSTQAKKSIIYQLIGIKIMTQFPTATRKQRQTMQKELNIVHRQNLQRRLHHRLEVARADGNATLIQQLEHEMNLIG